MASCHKSFNFRFKYYWCQFHVRPKSSKHGLVYLYQISAVTFAITVTVAHEQWSVRWFGSQGPATVDWNHFWGVKTYWSWSNVCRPPMFAGHVISSRKPHLCVNLWTGLCRTKLEMINLLIINGNIGTACGVMFAARPCPPGTLFYTFVPGKLRIFSYFYQQIYHF